MFYYSSKKDAIALCLIVLMTLTMGFHHSLAQQIHHSFASDPPAVNVQQSTHIVEGVVEQVTFEPQYSGSNVGKARIVVSVNEYIKGEGDNSVTFYRDGVIEKNGTMQWSDKRYLHSYEEGDHVVVQLIQAEKGPYPFIFNGLQDGKFLIKNGKVHNTSTSLSDLKSIINTASNNGSPNQLRELVQSKSATTNRADNKTHTENTKRKVASSSPATMTSCYSKGSFASYTVGNKTFATREYLDWDESSMPANFVYDDANEPSSVSASDMKDIMDAAILNWESVRHLGINFNTPTLSNWSPSNIASDDNVLKWSYLASSDANGETHTFPTDYSNSSASQYKDGIQYVTIHLNRYQSTDYNYDETSPPSTRSNSNIDLVEVLMHELGHAQSLLNVSGQNNLMHGDYTQRKTNIRQLSTADKAGAVFKYTEDDMSGYLNKPLVIGKFHDEAEDIGSLHTNSHTVKFVRGALNLVGSSTILEADNGSTFEDEYGCSFAVEGNSSSQILIDNSNDFFNGAIHEVDGPNIKVDNLDQKATNVTINGSNSNITVTNGAAFDLNTGVQVNGGSHTLQNGDLTIANGATVDNASLTVNSDALYLENSGQLKNSTVTINGGRLEANSDQAVSINTSYDVNSGTFEVVSGKSPTFKFASTEGLNAFDGSKVDIHGGTFMSSDTSNHNWAGLDIQNEVDLDIENATVRDANWGIYTYDTDNHTIYIYNTTFKQNELYAIKANGSTFYADTNRIINNGGHGLYLNNNWSRNVFAGHVVKDNDNYGVIVINGVASLCHDYQSNFCNSSPSGTVIVGNEIGVDASDAMVFIGETENGSQDGGDADLSNNSIWSVRVANYTTIEAEYTYWNASPQSPGIINNDGTSTVDSSNFLLNDPYPIYNENEPIDYPELVLNSSAKLSTENGNLSFDNDMPETITAFRKRLVKRFEVSSNHASNFIDQNLSNPNRRIRNAAKILEVELTREQSPREAVSLAKDYISNTEFSKTELKNLRNMLFLTYLMDLDEYSRAKSQYQKLRELAKDPILKESMKRKFAKEAGSVPSEYTQPEGIKTANHGDDMNVTASNHPNPFNPTTTIKYTLAKKGKVSIAVYNLTGQQVAELVDGVKESGSHMVQFNAGNLASGLYLYRLKTPKKVITKKMTLIK